MRSWTRLLYSLLAILGITGAGFVIHADGTIWQGALILGFALVMGMDAASWTAVGANGSLDKGLTGIDLAAVISSGFALGLAILAVETVPILVKGAVLAVFLYTVCCALFWWRIPRTDRYLLGKTLRAWGEHRCWDRVALEYRLLFVFGAVVTALIWVAFLKDPVEAAEDRTWMFMSFPVGIYAGIYFFLGAPMKRLFWDPLPGENVFLSYTHADAAAAGDLCDALREKALTVFYDVDAAHVAASLRQDLRRIIRGSDTFVVLLSNEAVQSDWVKLELECAVDSVKDRGRLRPAIIPVILDPAASSAARAMLEGAGLGDDPLLIEPGNVEREIEHLRRRPYDSAV